MTCPTRRLRRFRSEGSKRGSKAVRLSPCDCGRFSREWERHADFPAHKSRDCPSSFPAVLRDPVVHSLFRDQSHKRLGPACEPVPRRFPPSRAGLDLAERENEMGPQHNRCLSFGVDPSGLYLSIMFLFRIGSPSLLIPWPEVTV